MVLVIGVTMAGMAGACGAISGFLKIYTPGGIGPTRRSRETMHGQTCMASTADNGVDQDFDQDRNPASVAGRPGRATAPGRSRAATADPPICARS